jgi:hypothetical protein
VLVSLKLQVTLVNSYKTFQIWSLLIDIHKAWSWIIGDTTGRSRAPTIIKRTKIGHNRIHVSAGLSEHVDDDIMFTIIKRTKIGHNRIHVSAGLSEHVDDDIMFT